jgi:asparagine synthase (glutamine-hydrolysing)
MEFMGTVPAGLKLKDSRCKHLLKEAMKDCLQPSALGRPKQGFSIPLHDWLRGGMREYAADRLLAPNAFINSYLRSDVVRWLWDAHQRGQNYGTELWTLLMLELWGSQYVKMAREGIGTSVTALTMSGRSS